MHLTLSSSASDSAFADHYLLTYLHCAMTLSERGAE